MNQDKLIMSNLKIFFYKLFPQKVEKKPLVQPRKKRRNKVRLNKLENRVEILINKVVHLESENHNLHIKEIRNQQSS